MSYETTSQINETLKEILGTLADIADSIAYIAASTDKPGGVVEMDASAIVGAFHSDGGVNLGGGTAKTFRTYGDPTVLSGNEEGLK